MDSGPGSSTSVSTMESQEISLDPLSPSSSGYLSPIGSDAIQTPFIGDHEQTSQMLCIDPREPEAGIYEYIGSPAYTEDKCQKGAQEYTSDSTTPPRVFSPPSPTSPRYRNFSSFSVPQSDKDAEENPFDISFGAKLSKEKTAERGDGASRQPEEGPRSPPCHTQLLSFQHETWYNYDAHLYCRHFPEGHQLNRHFVQNYALEDELGAGGYGFVMTARHRERGYEVAVKFIIKEKVPAASWMVDEALGRLPTEVLLLCFTDHANIIKCLDLYEDGIYYYMIQELHGCPWSNPKYRRTQHVHPVLQKCALSSPRRDIPSTKKYDSKLPPDGPIVNNDRLAPHRPEFSRRPSHDLFECIEQSEHKRLAEDQARYVFKQVVEAVHYLDVQGVSHRDLKDENIVIDKDLKVKLIDFGSAVIVDPTKPRPFYDIFFGTTAYAASEILLKKPYQAPPAEVWTLGVLLSYLLTGTSPFPTMQDAIEGKLVFTSAVKRMIPPDAMELMRKCLMPEPTLRATIAEVREHHWLIEPGRQE